MYKFQFKRAIAYDWTFKNPVLGEAEPGYEIGTGRFKIGDGRTPWLDLPYFTIGGSLGQLPEDVVTIEQFNAHIASLEPHPLYDDEGVSPFLLYENAKV
jgi:hypothetical protein